MKSLHILLRLFVLAAMTLSFAESVWASTCASMSMMAMTDAAADDVAMPGMPGMPADGGQPGGEDDPWCPLGPAAVAQGCLTAASLPAASGEPFAAPAERDARHMHVDAASEHVYAAPPFHPPRA